MDDSKVNYMPLISIIIPIYKVEKYLEKCVSTVIDQTYKNIEIILVDDGSPDRCGTICDNLSLIDNRIRVLHKNNGGLSNARNAGIDIARGQYLAFVDSDDFISNQYIELLYKSLYSTGAEIAICSYANVYENGTNIAEKTVSNSNRNEVISGHDLLKKVMTSEGGKYVVAWNKLYRAELFKSLRFDDGKLYEDERINFKLFWNCKKVVLVNETLYYYLQRNQSIVGSKMTISKIDMAYEMHKERIHFYKQKDNALFLRATQMCANWIINCYRDNPDILDEVHKKEMRQFIYNNVKLLYHSSESSVGEKFQNCLAVVSPPIAALVKGKIRHSLI